MTAAVRTAVGYALWPLLVAAAVGCTALGIGRGHDPGVVFLVVSVATLALTLAAEQAVPLRPEWNALTDRQSLNDLGHGIVQSTLGDRLGGLVLVTLGTAAGARLAAVGASSVWPTAWPLALQVLLGVALADGLDYWKHRALHTDFGWRLHALHHGITRLHALKSARSHVGEVVLRFLCVYTPLLSLGAPADVVFWHAVLIGTLGVIGHSNVHVRLPAFVHAMLMTPQVHRLHHSSQRVVADTNFANIFPAWDVVFGTFSHPRDRVLRGVGVVGDPMPAGFVRQLLFPFTRPPADVG
jgi:sterol desaturase/sphingolipid hydroxylase (fatty acid hydroxylase superfamily)